MRAGLRKLFGPFGRQRRGSRSHGSGLVGISARTATRVGQDQATDAVRVPERHAGGDHPAPRDAQQVGAINGERVEQTNVVPDIIVER